MRPFLVVQLLVTAVLLLAIITFAGLVATGKLEVRLASQAPSAVAPAAGGARNPIGAKARLVVLRGLKPGVEFQLFEGNNFIGRADQKPVDVDIEDQEPQDRVWSSRQHALITCENGALVIEDLNSANGTYVNRERVPPGQRRQLKPNDVVQIGTVQMQVRF